MTGDTVAIQRFREEHFYLSNMYPLEPGLQTPDGHTVVTSEHLFQAARLLDRLARVAVEEVVDGKAAKRLFRQYVADGVPIIDDLDTKIAIMRDCVLLKFATHPDLAQQLLATGDEELIEGNDWGDNVWGVSPPPPVGNGANWLGCILMETRARLAEPGFSADTDVIMQRIFSHADQVLGPTDVSE